VTLAWFAGAMDLVNGDPAFLNALANTLIITILQLILYLLHFLSWVVVVALFQHVLGFNGPLEKIMGGRSGRN